MFSRIKTAVVSGIEGKPVYVETDMTRGLPGMYVVGLASTMVMESRERVKSAIINSGIEFPHTRITINLTPANLRKNGSGLDLPMAIGILVSAGYVDVQKCDDWGFAGELSLDGRVLGVDGLLPIVVCLRNSGIKKIMVPRSNSEEASLLHEAEIYPVDDLNECIDILNGLKQPSPMENFALKSSYNIPTIDFSDISGQEEAKRAITIAVAGRHGLLMVGSPGCGKTMLSRRIPTIMPPMSEDELVETAIIHSAVGQTNSKSNGDYSISIERPFRNPHHTIGRAGLIGGGTYPIPGEISLAHNGVLFLDEACEFDQEKIESLRLPIEDRQITITRRGMNYTFPCNFQLVMSSNPCPCGFYGDQEKMCRCTEAQLEKYRKKLSGPIIDRIDMRITMAKVSYSEMRSATKGTSSKMMREQIASAREFASRNGRSKYNAELSDREMQIFCSLGAEEDSFMKSAYTSLHMTPRSYVRTIKVARTIADLDGCSEIRISHLAEALRYRVSGPINE